MQHIGRFLRSIPTQTLQGKTIAAVMDGDVVIRPAVPGWDSGKWTKESKREVERELARRNRRKKAIHSQGLLDDEPKVIPSGRRKSDLL